MFLNNSFEKLRYIFIPYLYVSIFCIATCSLLNLYFGQTGNGSLSENTLQLWIPTVFPFLPLSIWIWRRIKWLMLERKIGRDLHGFYFFIAWISIMIPNMLSQFYITEVVGKCTSLASITELNTKAHTKFYQLRRYQLDKSRAAVQTSSEVTGKNKSTLIYSMYITVPIYESKTDTLCPIAWLGWKDKISISNHDSQGEKTIVYNNFVRQTEGQFTQVRLEGFRYLRRIGNNEDLEKYGDAIASTTSCGTKSPEVFLPFYEPFEDRGGYRLLWIIWSWMTGAFIWFLMLLIPQLKPDVINRFTIK